MFKKIINSFKLKFYNPYKRAEFYKKQGVRMGKNCQVFSGVGFGSEPYLIKIGDNVKITNGTSFITHDGGIEVLRNLQLLPNADFFAEIKVGNNVFFGNRCTVLPGVNIGDNVVIGAGCIVTKDIPSNSVCAGIPARVIKSIDEYYDSLKSVAVFTKNFTQDEKKSFLLKKFDIN